MGDKKQPSDPHSRGYRRLADFMAWNPSYAIFYRFRAANALNLLGLQAEISRLESRLLQTTIQDENQAQDPVKKTYQNDWTSLQDGEGGNSQQWKLILDLRQRLNEYSNCSSVKYPKRRDNINRGLDTAIVNQITINQQVDPSKRNLENLRAWIEDIYGLGSSLRGHDSRIWFTKEEGEDKLNDKVAIWPEGSGRDGFSSLIFKALGLFAHSRIPSYFSFFFWVRVHRYQHTKTRNLTRLMNVMQKRRFPASQPDGLQRTDLEDRDIEMYLDSGAVVRAGDKIATVISCLLVTVPIIVLHYVKNAGIRLGLIVVFTLIFSLALVFVSDASRKDIFAASAAFVAVQVIYVAQ